MADPKPEPKLCNCSFNGPDPKSPRVPSGNCPIHGSS